MNSDNSSNPELPQSKFGLGNDHSDLIVLGIKYFRIVGLVFFVWLIGYYDFSVAWILFVSFIYLWRERVRNARILKAEMIKAVQIDEKNAILARLDEIPSWVYFPDKDRAEWLNKILKQFWPYFRNFMNLLFKETIEPIIQASLPPMIGTLKCQKIDFGDIPPRIGSIKVYTERILPGEVMMDIELLYAGDAKIKLEAKNILVGVKSMQFQGNLRVVLKPLCDRMPLFAAVTMFFLSSPSFDFVLTDVASAFDIPGLNDMLKTTVSDILSKFLVLPNRLVIPIIPDYTSLNTSFLSTPQPKGVIRLQVIRATNLKRADINVFGKGKSDPYVKISGIGSKESKTKVIDDTINPEWNETFHFVIEDLDSNSKLYLNVYDKDLQNDDFLGGLSLNVKEMIDKKSEEGVFDLKNTKTGKLVLKYEWFYLSSDLKEYETIKKKNQHKSELPYAVLLVNLKSACELQNVLKKVGGITEPNPYAILSMREQKIQSATQTNTTNPNWNENYFFMIYNLEHEFLNVTIMDKKFSKNIGSVEISVADLLKQNELSSDRQYDLSCVESSYLPKVHLALRLMIFSDEAHDISIPPSLSTELLNKTSETNSPQPKTEVDKPSPSPSTPDTSSNIADDSSKSALGKLIANQPTEYQGIRNRIQKQESVTSDLGYGQIKITLHYRLQENLLITTIHSCKGLPMVGANKNNLPDPYVRLFLLPDQKIKKRTKAIHDSQSPSYEETFQWDIQYNEVKKRQLHVSLKNDKPVFSHEKVYMGEVLIDLSRIDINSPITKWYTIQEQNDFLGDRI